jgi:DUF4097 and DUF4098 domain-containing protein YvlB
MTTITRVWLIAATIVAGSLAPAPPAAAQDRHDWVQNLERQIEATVNIVAERVEREIARAQRNPRRFDPPGPPDPPSPPRRGRDRRDPEFTDMFTRTAPLGRTGTFDLSNVAGDIVITGGGGDDVRIEAVKRVRERSEADARELLRLIDIQVTERGGSVEVRTEMPRRRNGYWAVDYTVAVPSGANVTVKSVSGDLRVSNVRGELRAESVSGDVSATSTGRLRHVRSVSGDVLISDVDGDDLTGGTISGDVVIRNIKARSVDFDTVSGDLRFTEADCERLNLKSNSGNIEYAGRLVRNGRYELQSFSGEIRIVPTGNPGFDLEATTFSGDVRSDYGLTLQGTGNSLVGRGRGPGRSVRASFGDASAILSLRSFSGDIVIVKR